MCIRDSAGTALGAHREKQFIQHDHDIDIAVFYNDVKTPKKAKEIINAMKKYGLSQKVSLGTLERGKELGFIDDETKIPLDIFFVYRATYRGKDYNYVSSYYGECDKMRYKMCVWGYRYYKTVKKHFMGKIYNVVPVKTLTDMYGSDWKVVKNFSYHEGLLEDGGYKGLVPDFFNPIDESKKIAFCFLLYDKIAHQKIWENFFKQDRNPVKSYNIYSHVKEVNKNTPEWIVKNKVRTVKTRWCGESLVKAFILMIEKALKNKDNKYIALFSGECLPLYNFWDTYKNINKSDKSRMEFTRLNSKGMSYYYASQWVLLNRKTAEILVNMDMKKMRKQLREIGNHCPDEIFPIYALIDKLGNPSSKKFKSLINKKPITQTFWKSGNPHPIKYTKLTPKDKKKFCESGALFARKFGKNAADEIGMNC